MQASALGPGAHVLADIDAGLAIIMPTQGSNARNREQ